MCISRLYSSFYLGLRKSRKSWIRIMSLTRKDYSDECRHDMRPSVQLPNVWGVDSKLGLTMGSSLQSALESSPLTKHYDRRAAIFWRFWRPVTMIFDLSTENWHCTYSCPVERLYQVWLFCFFLFSSYYSPYRMDGRARRVMPPL